MAGDRSDEELMREVARGRADRLECLVRRYAVHLMTFLSRMVGDRHPAEEPPPPKKTGK
jgi:DNA-directed RNA polymerase specialized sigma24 family protein